MTGTANIRGRTPGRRSYPAGMPPGPDRRLPVPTSWLEPRGPRSGPARERWRELAPDERRELVRRSLTPGDAPGPDESVVRALAEDLVRSSGRAGATAAFVGWLVLMTLWGFGRSAAPDAAGVFLAVGLVAGAATAVAGVRRARRRSRRARAVVRVLGQRTRRQA